MGGLEKGQIWRIHIHLFVKEKLSISAFTGGRMWRVQFSLGTVIMWTIVLVMSIPIKKKKSLQNKKWINNFHLSLMAPVLFHCLQWTSSIKSLGFNLWARILAIAGREVVGREEIFYWKNKSSKRREKYVSLPFPQPHCEYSFVEAAGQGQRSEIHSGGWFQNITHLQKCCWRFCCSLQSRFPV